MSREEPTTRDIEIAIFHKLARRGAWGEAYMPRDTLTRWLSKKIKKDGKRIRKIMDSMIREGYLIPHKGGKTISLNPSRSGDILRAIEEFLR